MPTNRASHANSRHSPGRGIVAKTMRGERMLERSFPLCSYRQCINPLPECRIFTRKEVFLAVLHPARQRLQHFDDVTWHRTSTAFLRFLHDEMGIPSMIRLVSDDLRIVEFMCVGD